MPSTYHFIFSYTKAGARAECQIGEDRTHTFNFFLEDLFLRMCKLECIATVPMCVEVGGHFQEWVLSFCCPCWFRLCIPG